MSDVFAHDDRGYAMAALLVGMSVMAILMSMALPAWRTAAKREREAELIFRGEQYAHAIELYSRRNGGFPPSLDVLEKGRFIRKLYKDPVNGEGDFQPVYLGQVIAGQPVVPGQPGRGGQGGGQGRARGGASGGGLGGGPAGAPSGRTGQAPGTGGRGAAAATPFPGARAGQPAGSAPGQPGQPGVIGAGPIIGVVSKSTAESMRLYNGRGRYNEWAFVAIAATPQAGAPGGGQNPGGARGGRGVGRGAEQGVPGRGGPGRFGPGRGLPGRGDPAAGRGNPFGLPGVFPPPGGQQPGRAPAPRP